MRIADKMNFDQVNSGLQRNRAELSDLQNKSATQKRVNKPSDDPLATTRVLSARSEINSSQQYLKNINQAKTFLEYSDQSLGELTEVLSRAKELAISQSNDAGANEATRRVVATEIDQLLGQTIQVGNRKIGDRFLFGGFQTVNPPFTPDGEYTGDDGEIYIGVSKEAHVAMNMPGSRVFLGKNDNAGKRTDDPAAPVENKAVEQNSESPKNTAPEKPGRQPVVMPRGPALVEPSKDDPNVMPEDKSKAQLSATWRNGGTNLFSLLSDMSVALRVNSKEGVQDTLDRLDEAIAQVVLARSEVGSRLSTLNSATENQTKGVVDSKALASSMEDVDTFELVSDLNKSETTLKASLASAGKLIQPSLLDFLR